AGTISGCVGTSKVRNNCPMDQPHTTLTGTVNIPAGTLPLYNAKVFIPAGPVPMPLASGVSCDRCDAIPLAAAYATTDYNGQFTLTDVPSGQNIPLVISLGKWQRVITLQQEVKDCTTTALDPQLTRLPRNKSEGNIPKIALSTGAADALECLLRTPKLG